MTYEHPLGFSCEDVDDRTGDLESALAEAHRSLALIHEWLCKAIERRNAASFEGEQEAWSLVCGSIVEAGDRVLGTSGRTLA